MTLLVGLLLLVVLLFFWRQLSVAKARTQIAVLERALQDTENDLVLAQQTVHQLQQEQQTQKSIQQILQPFKEQLHQFHRRVNDIHTQSMMGQASLQQQVQQMMQANIKMGEDAQQLAQALKGNKKVLGNWGELQLETALEHAGLQKEVNYFTQPHFKNQQGERLIPDVVVALPEGRQLIIDSKVSLAAYQQAVAEANSQRVERYLKQLVKDVRAHVDDLARKDYAGLPDIQSVGFVMMFMPIEAAYVEALRQDEELFQYAYAKGVVLVSQTSLLPTLRTVANVWMLSNSHRELQEIGDRAVDTYNQLVTVAEHLSRLGTALNNANKVYNQAMTSFAGQQGLVSKLDKFQRLSAKSVKVMPELGGIDIVAETDKLQSLSKD
ncbi:DNA recombination protein RmuC [Pelistega suis]|uniref:DNA recombination protein RmuC n=1 Tax=Pelistega suis TaxID=1631957 RepID=UPI00211BC56B|nr:DNA recombination protein RmuC [Pelistega suis]MCQ9329470.1 DNA recombination protein RmuC [Pelistega suis]